MTETTTTGDATTGTAKKLRNQSLLLLFAALFTSPLFLFFVLSFPLGMGVMFHLGHQARVLLPVPCVVFCLLSLVWAWRTSKALPERKIGDAPVFLLMSVAVAVLLLSIPMFFHTLTALTRTKPWPRWRRWMRCPGQSGDNIECGNWGEGSHGGFRPSTPLFACVFYGKKNPGCT